MLSRRYGDGPPEISSSHGASSASDADVPRSEGAALVVDDDPELAEACAQLLRRHGIASSSCTSAAEALARLEDEVVDLVVVDLRMPTMDGMELLQEVKRRLPELPVVLMSGGASIPRAVEALRSGAADFVTKPFTPSRLLEVVRSQLRGRAPRDPAHATVPDADDPVPELLGISTALRRVKARILVAARSECPVLISGPSGTGKELVARAVHDRSARAAGPFVPVNCGALARDLVESELFGTLKGAYTGAGVSRGGLFQAAHRGTLFLDEIGEMPLDAQVKLLRALQEHAVRPVGASRERPVSVRVLAATNRPTADALREGLLREDFFFRLAAFTVDLPALRERPEDVAPTARGLLVALRRERGCGPTRLGPEALRCLEAYPWPGNVRELRNALEGSLARAPASPILTLEALPGWVRSGAAPGSLPASTAAPPFPTMGLREGEEYQIRTALQRAGGNKSEAARLLRISRPLLYKRMKRLGMDL